MPAKILTDKDADLKFFFSKEKPSRSSASAPKVTPTL